MTDVELQAQLDEEYQRIIAETLFYLRSKRPGSWRKIAAALYAANRRYWTARLAIIDTESVFRAETMAASLTTAYTTAAETFSAQVRGIYANYEKAFHLTHKEAEQFLKGQYKYDKTITQNLKAVAAGMPEGAEKDALNAKISAPAYQYRIQRAEEMTRQAKEVCDSIANAETNADRAFLQTEAERAYNITLQQELQKTPAQAIIQGQKSDVFTPTAESGIQDSFTLINKKAVQQIVNRDWSGENFSKRVWDNTDELAKEIKTVLLNGELTGASESDMSAKIIERFNVAEYKARRVVRTESNYVVNQAEKAGLQAAGYDRYQFASLHEANDCDTCDDLDGQVFKWADAAVGVNFPPVHPFCRCKITAPEETLEDIEKELLDLTDGMSINEWLDSIGAAE